MTTSWNELFSLFRLSLNDATWKEQLLPKQYLGTITKCIGNMFLQGDHVQVGLQRLGRYGPKWVGVENVDGSWEEDGQFPFLLWLQEQETWDSFVFLEFLIIKV